MEQIKVYNFLSGKVLKDLRVYSDGIIKIPTDKREFTFALTDTRKIMFMETTGCLEECIGKEILYFIEIKKEFDTTYKLVFQECVYTLTFYYVESWCKDGE